MAAVEQRAVRRAARYLGFGSELGRVHLLRINRLGVLGEDAVEHHLASLGLEVRSIAEDWLSGGSDWGDLSVVVPYGTESAGSVWWIEVKTIGAKKWATGHRNPIRDTRSSAVVWCTAATGVRPPWVRILGWAPVSEIDGDGTDVHMRPINEIDAWFRRPWFEP